MKKLLKLITIIFFFFINYSFSSEKIVYLDLDYLISNSNKGKQILLDLEKIDKENLKIIKSQEKILKGEEQSLLKKKNIISEEAYNKEIQEIKKKINLFRSEKNQLANNLKTERKKKINEFLKVVDKILSEYVENNSIDIVLNKKDILMGKNSYNITDEILKKVDEID